MDYAQVASILNGIVANINGVLKAIDKKAIDKKAIDKKEPR